MFFISAESFTVPNVTVRSSILAALVKTTDDWLRVTILKIPL